MAVKELYFTENNINDVSLSIIDKIKLSTEIKPLRDCSQNIALLIIDMQNYFLSNKSHAFIPSAFPIIAKINTLTGLFLKYKFPIIYTRHINNDLDSGMMKIWWRDLLIRGDKLSDLSNDIVLSGNDIIVKNQYDAFYKTGLDQLLKKKNIRRVVITGVTTHLCCETTARSAFVKGYEVIFPVDTTATYNMQFHLSSILNLSHGFSYIVMSEKLINHLSNDNI